MSGEIEKKFLSLLQAAIQHKSSDIHLMTQQPPAIRSHQGLLPVNMPALTPEEMLQLCQLMITDAEVKAKLTELQDYDGSFDVKGLGRFRFNIYRTVQGIGAVLRVIGQKVPSIQELNLPPVLAKIAEASRGLVLVTGATGSGKSSTLAAMIDHLNSTQNLHILTIEDPIEYLHPQKKCRVSQREIGRDTKNFAVSLKSALRQDPDVILVGEMRDLETLDIAMKAAETGHLVFSTVHTSDAMKTIGRLISLFPPQEQASARLRLADNLHSIVSQRLVPGKHKARVVAQEILINNVGIQDCIANEKKTAEIPGFIEKGKEVSGMQTFDQHLAELVHTDQVSVETALEYASNPSDFQRNLSFGSTAIEGSSGLQTLGVESEAPAAEATTPPTPLQSAPPIPPPTATPPTPLAGGKTGLAIPSVPKIPKPPGAA
jgi:twitching motility protein PilT